MQEGFVGVMNDPQIPVLDDIPGGEVGLVAPVDFVHREPFRFDNGETLPGFTLRYETYGRLNRAKSNAILICHALTGDHHCAGVHSLDDRKPGWWNHMVGPGKPIDTDRFFVISSNCLGGCVGSTGPSSVNPETGRRYNLDFPNLTIGDMVRAQALLIDHLGIDQLWAVIGGSMGGMQALQWTVGFPERVKRLVALATTARHNAQAIGFNEVGRCAIMQDPEWKGGNYHFEAGPDVGLAVARMMAHITYLSDKGLEVKFGRSRQKPQSARQEFGAEFAIESYLRYQGQSFINRFDANTYLYFTKALDRYDLHQPTGRLEDQLRVMRARALVVGFTSDWLYPPWQNRELVHAMLRCGKDASYAELEMDLGHDSFLVHAPALFRLMREFLECDA